VIVSATSRPAPARGGTRRRPRKPADQARAVLASWSAVVVLCAVLTAVAILALRS